MRLFFSILTWLAASSFGEAQTTVNTFKPKEGMRVDRYLDNEGVFTLLWDKSDEVFVVTVQQIKKELWSTDLSNYFTITASIDERFKWKQIPKDTLVVRFTEKVGWNRRMDSESELSVGNKYIVFLEVGSPFTTIVNGVPDNKTRCVLVDGTFGISEYNKRLHSAVRGRAYLEHWVDK